MRKTTKTLRWVAFGCALATFGANEREANAQKIEKTEKKKTRTRAKPSELVFTFPPGTAYSVDDGPSQLADARRRMIVEPGEHRVHVLSGSRDVVVTVIVEQNASAVVRLPPVDSAPPLVVGTVMDAGVGETTYGPPRPVVEPPPPASGSTEPSAPVVEAKPSAPGPSSFALTPAPAIADVVPSAKAPIVLSLVAAAASLAAAGTGLAIASAGASSDADSLRAESLVAGRYCSSANGGGRCAEAVRADERADDMRAASIGALAGAGAFALSAVVVHFAWPKAPKVIVTGGPSASGASASATFRF